MTDQQMKDEILRISGAHPERCMKCGKCTATCPAFEEMEYHPHQFVSMVQEGQIQPLLESESLYRCLTCFACTERCPRGVEPARIVEAVRLLAIRRKGENRLTPDQIPGMLDDEMPQQAIVSAFRKYTK